MHCSRKLIVQTLVFSRSYLHRQVSPPETLVVKGGTTWARNGRWILSENARLPRNIQGSFTCRKSTTWDKRHYLPSEGRHAEDFFALKFRRFRPSLNLRTWVPKDSTLPLVHRSCHLRANHYDYILYYSVKLVFGFVTAEIWSDVLYEKKISLNFRYEVTWSIPLYFWEISKDHSA